MFHCNKVLETIKKSFCATYLQVLLGKILGNITMILLRAWGQWSNKTLQILCPHP